MPEPVLSLTLGLKRTLLIEAEAGTGKTEVAKALAAALNLTETLALLRGAGRVPAPGAHSTRTA